MATHKYKLTARSAMPDLAGEQRYLTTETEYAKKQLAKSRGRWWPFFSWQSVGLLRYNDWQKYVDALESYKHRIDAHEQEIAGGLLPFSIRVTNTSAHSDAKVNVRVSVEHGTILTRRLPIRPKRIDGAPNYVPNVPHFRGSDWTGFVRWGVRIGRQSVEAKFSKLEAHDSAVLVIPVLYLDGDEHTRLSFAVQSRNLESGEHGWVEFID